MSFWRRRWRIRAVRGADLRVSAGQRPARDGEIGVLKFLSGTRWKPGADIYGIFPMIVGSVYVTAGALLLGVPVALLTAVYLAFFCPKGLYRVLKPAVELLAGIPSVVYGFFRHCGARARGARSAKDGTAAATRCSPRRSCWRL